MRDFVQVTGMVIKTVPVGEYDRAVTILTSQRGKISAFARNSRKMNNRFMAATNPFCFGTFKLIEGRTAYTIADVEISQYFEGFRTDLEGAYYGMYFLEVADYYTRENNDDADMLKLVYQSLRALLHNGISNELVRLVFECKAMVVNGEFPGIPEKEGLLDTTAYTIRYIMDSPIEKLFTFTLREDVQKQFSEILEDYKKRIWNHEFHSLSFLKIFVENPV